MIPAILSCVFVVYLYCSLNQVPKSASALDEHSGSQLELSELATRLQSLQSRLAKLNQGGKVGGK